MHGVTMEFTDGCLSNDVLLANVSIAVPSLGKVQSRTGHEGQEGGGMRYSAILSLASALEGVGWSTPHLDGFTPGKVPIPIV